MSINVRTPTKTSGQFNLIDISLKNLKKLNVVIRIKRIITEHKKYWTQEYKNTRGILKMIFMKLLYFTNHALDIQQNCFLRIEMHQLTNHVRL